MTHVTCRLTAKNRNQLLNPTLGNRVWAIFTFTFYLCFTNTQVSFSAFCLVLYGCPFYGLRVFELQSETGKSEYKITEKRGSGIFQAPPPAPLARWTHLVSAPAVVHDTTQQGR